MYDGVVGSYAVGMPDLLHQKATPAQRTDIVSKLYNEIETNYKNYYDTLEGLMPFFLYDPVVNQGSVNFTWGESYDMQGKLVNYTFMLSTSPDFNNIVYKEDNIRSFSIDVPGLAPGTYYWKVIATTEDGRMAEAFNQIYTNDTYYDGIESLVIQ
jgi:spore coat protein H